YLRVRETLRALDCDKAVATNKPGELSRSILDQLGLARAFIAVLGEDDVGARKPDPLIVDILRGKVGAGRAQTLYVGDSLVDAEAAARDRIVDDDAVEMRRKTRYSRAQKLRAGAEHDQVVQRTVVRVNQMVDSVN